MNISGKSRKTQGHPYSRVLGVAVGVVNTQATGTALAFPVDVTTLSLSPNPVFGTPPLGTVGSPATGARHGSTGCVVFIPATGGTLVWKDAVGVSNSLVLPAAPTGVQLPFTMTEITSFVGATASIVLYWDD